MKEFLLILFFSKVINLTAQSTAIDHKLSLNASPPISAITPGALLEIDDTRADELAGIARDLGAPKAGGAWAHDIVSLFKAIPHRLEPNDSADELEVAFE